MWMYRSREMAHRFTMLAVEHITSDEIHSLQKDSPNIHESKSFMSAKGITKAVRNMNNMYRVTHHIVQNLPLTSKHKFCFGLAMPGHARPKRNICFEINGRFWTT